ncbi:hypothetical protein, variant [Capsaspora owczarzaki ATCC 30864]|uniref:Peptidase M16C associated domain-containing protein n=1 Tax=Capsaspora owczarzaki (strain ATCC 30864) TaxID=595528 RepID=A0A0D2WIB8_CAPO3|nr:hypothetical protein, variant [Capsaspora owczarzaki ATCC 30864]
MTSSFEQVEAFTLLDVGVTRYRSNASGLTVCLAETRGPLVGAYLALSTEAHDDDGLPHTLEHLVFMGSEDYPYKGVLDLIANRSLAQGTNAWTATDHTCYTLTTAGEEGMLAALPVYLDHVLYPTLTDTAYQTEVHHITGAGEDAGVVYCEMQAIENTSDSRTYRALVEHLYPGRSGYKSETGGRLGNLRDSCSHEKVCQYHRDYYRPDNLCIIIAGKIDPAKLFEAIAPFDAKVVSKKHVKQARPWSTPSEALTTPHQVVRIQFPTEDESTGIAMAGWRGPKWSSFLELQALETLWTYLTDTPVAVLQRELVEIDDPYCSDLSFRVERYSDTAHHLTLESVPTEKLGEIDAKLGSVLRRVASGEITIDMERMASVIHQLELQLLSQADDDPHQLFVGLIIEDFCYGNTNGKQLQERLATLSHLKTLSTKPASFWSDLVRTALVESPLVLILGEPSAPLGEQMLADENKRLEEQRARFGEQGLVQLGEQLAQASKRNSVETPDAVLAKISVPGVERIPFHELKTEIAGANQQPHNLPFAFKTEHVNSSFVVLTATLDTTSVPANLRPYLSLYLNLFFESGVTRPDGAVSHEQVIAGLAEDTLEHHASLGLGGRLFMCGAFAQHVVLSIKAERSKYQRAVNWLRELLFSIRFTEERVKVTAINMLNEVADLKRDGMSTVRTLLNELLIPTHNVAKSNHTVSNVVRQQQFVRGLLESIGVNQDEADEDDEEGAEDGGEEGHDGEGHDGEGHNGGAHNDAAVENQVPSKSPEEVAAAFKQVFDALYALRDVLVGQSVGFLVDVAGSLPAPDMLAPWHEVGFVADHQKAVSRQQTAASEQGVVVHWSGDVVVKPTDRGQAAIVGVSSVESAFLMQTCPSIASWTDPDLPALLVATEYLTALEVVSLVLDEGSDGETVDFDLVEEGSPPFGFVVCFCVFRCRDRFGAIFEASVCRTRTASPCCRKSACSPSGCTALPMSPRRIVWRAPLSRHTQTAAPLLEATRRICPRFLASLNRCVSRLPSPAPCMASSKTRRVCLQPPRSPC